MLYFTRYHTVLCLVKIQLGICQLSILYFLPYITVFCSCAVNSKELPMTIAYSPVSQMEYLFYLRESLFDK